MKNQITVNESARAENPYIARHRRSTDVLGRLSVQGKRNELQGMYGASLPKPKTVRKTPDYAGLKDAFFQGTVCESFANADEVRRMVI